MILAFDLATQTGWAAGDREPVMGSRHLGWSHSEVGGNLVFLMQELVGKYDPELILFERPIRKIVIQPDRFGNMPKIKLNPDTIYRLSGLAYLCEAMSAAWGIRCEAVNVHTARAAFLGKGMVPVGRDNVKAAVIEGCKLRGWSVQNDDEGDAACIWASQARGALGSPLFAEGNLNGRSPAKRRSRTSVSRLSSNK